MNAPVNTQVIITAEVATYVTQFNAHSKRSVESYLEMCRVVFIAKRKLGKSMFNEFCAEINLAAGSSSISKMTTIGSKYSVLYENRDQLPSAWTTIYPLATLPEHVLIEKLTDKTIHQGMDGKDAKALVPTKRKYVKADLKEFPGDDSAQPVQILTDANPSASGSGSSSPVDTTQCGSSVLPFDKVSPIAENIADTDMAALPHMLSYVFKVKGRLTDEEWDLLSGRLMDACDEVGCDLFEFDKE
jgi:hypothetical protein